MTEGSNTKLIGCLTPLVRAYIRYLPIAAGKRSFWTRFADPYFAWNPRPFEATTVFGMKMAGNTADDYSALSYLPPHTEARPARIRNSIQSYTDLVFSRRDTEQL